VTKSNEPKDKPDVGIGSIGGDQKGNIAGRDINIYADPKLQAKVTALEEKIANLEKVRGDLGDEQIDAALAPLKEQLATLQAQQPQPDYRTPDPTTLEQHYLSRLQAQVSHLSLLHIDPGAAESRMELAQVYTALLTTGSEEQRQRGRAEMMADKPPRISALAQLNRHDRLVILGDPGSGKSTFVNFVVLCMTGERLTGDGTYLELLRTPLPPDEDDISTLRREKKVPEPQPWDHGALLPIKIVLRKFANEGLPPPGQAATAKHLWHYLTVQLEQADLADYIPILKHRFQQEGGLLLFDGLDELPDPEQRGPQLKQVVEDVATRYRACRIVVTSRPYAYQNPAWQLPDFLTTTLAPFSQGQIEQFIDRWYRYLGVLNQWPADNRRRRVEQLNQAIFGHQSRLRSLAERPLLLTLMANLHASRGTLPEKRAQLYEETVVLLLDRWERGRFSADNTVLSPRLSDWLEVEQSKIRVLLEELAYDAHANQPAQAEGTANLDGAKLLQGLLDLTRRDLHPADLLDYLDQRAGILEALGDNVYRFPHRTFQEYLAACYLTDADYPDRVADLTRSEPNRWREVALLAGAKAASGTVSALWVLVEALCYRDAKREQTTAEDRWGALLAGQLLSETADLSQIPARHQPKVERIRSWLKHILATNGLPAVERATAGQVLAAPGVGDDREGVGMQAGLPEMAWCEVEAGAFTMGSDERDNEKPPHEVTLPTYRISRYPVTNAQFAPFIDDGGYTDKWRQCWTEAGWQEKEKTDWQQPHYWHNSRYNQANQPVVGVSWYEAVAYCRWLTERLRAAGELEQAEVIRLPTEAEWEKAARGSDGRRYPWGDEANPDKANYVDTGLGDPCAVGCFVQGESPYGCQDMSGNVWEWGATQGKKGEYELQPYPYQVMQQWDEAYLKGTDVRVLRGGAYSARDLSVRASMRSHFSPNIRDWVFGFRVVRAPIGSES
jgi:formylglycine-generating enzyme required for sulfatase activity